MTEVNLEGGKYIVKHENGANLRAERYGEPWRDLCGDGLVLALVQRIETLEELRPRLSFVDSEVIAEAAEVLQMIQDSGVTLPPNWRGPLLDELSGIAAIVQAQLSK